jgi:hypothetical protein
LKHELKATYNGAKIAAHTTTSAFPISAGEHLTHLLQKSQRIAPQKVHDCLKGLTISWFQRQIVEALLNLIGQGFGMSDTGILPHLMKKKVVEAIEMVLFAPAFCEIGP